MKTYSGSNSEQFRLWTTKQKRQFIKENNQISLTIGLIVARLGDLLYLKQHFKAFGNN